jgi:hypothetical protein
MSIARQLLSKHILAATNTQTTLRTAVSMQLRGKHTSVTIEELLENGVSCGSAPKLYN